ncbi:MAG TPA: hypothetical protein VGN16_09685 [Acidobacteriaceae bacterium]|jgi:hypothetical protein
MFADEFKIGVRENPDAGLWAVHISTEQYWTWKIWRMAELNSHPACLPEWLTVQSEWPPVTAAAAMRVAEAVSKIRDEAKVSLPVKRRPAPWDGKRVPVPEEHRAKSVE